MNPSEPNILLLCLAVLVVGWICGYLLGYTQKLSRQQKLMAQHTPDHPAHKLCMPIGDHPAAGTKVRARESNWSTIGDARYNTPVKGRTYVIRAVRILPTGLVGYQLIGLTATLGRDTWEPIWLAKAFEVIEEKAQKAC